MGVCVTLNEGYLRAANRGSKNLYRFLIKIYLTYQPSIKRRIFLGCRFYCFFILQIYEAFAAIFWQSARYVWLNVYLFDLTTLRLHFFKKISLNSSFVRFEMFFFFVISVSPANDSSPCPSNAIQNTFALCFQFLSKGFCNFGVLCSDQ